MVEELLPTRLRVLRAERGLTLRAAAKLTGVAKETLSALERGQRHPHDPTLAKIAKGYGVPVEELLNREEGVIGLEASGAGHEVDSSPKDEAPSPPEISEEERRVSELGRWIEYIERRAGSWARQATAEENPFLADWKAAIGWESGVLEEALDMRNAAEKAAKGLMEGGTAHGEAAQNLQRLEDAYRRLGEASQKVVALVGEVVSNAKKEAVDRALEETIARINEEELERTKKYEALQERVSA